MPILEVHMNRDKDPVTVVIQGHPDQCIDQARELCQFLLGGHAWHFTSLVFKPPKADQQDSDWELTAKAEVK